MSVAAAAAPVDVGAGGEVTALDGAGTVGSQVVARAAVPARLRGHRRPVRAPEQHRVAGARVVRGPREHVHPTAGGEPVQPPDHRGTHVGEVDQMHECGGRVGLDALQAPALGAPAVPAALPVGRLSYSGLESYKRCGYRFYLERALRLPGGHVAEQPVRPGPGVTGPSPPAESPSPLPALLRGSLIHLLLEEMDFAVPTVPPAERVEELIDAHGEEVRPADVNDLCSMVERFAASPLRRRIASAARVRTELPFAFSLEPDGAGGRSLLINGVVDVHAVEDRGVLIVDYKSDRLGERDPALLTAEAYETQRLVYALAALRAGHDRVEVAYCFLECPEEPVASVFGTAEAPELERRLVELAAGVVSGSFRPSDRPHLALCAGCPGQPALCSWGPERTLAAEPA